MLTRSHLILLVATTLLGCASDAEAFADYMEDDLPAGNCRGTGSTSGNCETDTDGDTDSDTDPTMTGGSTTGGGESSTGPTDACSQSDECMGGVCAGQFDPDTAGRGAFECVFACLENFDDVGWCADDSAWCDAEATCSPRGYCLPPEA